MGQVLTKQIQLNVKNSFKQLMDKVQKMDGVFDIRRCEYIENNKFLINFVAIIVLVIVLVMLY